MITWTADYVGTPDDRDIAGARFLIGKINEKRLADVDENGDPKLPPLPMETGAQLRASLLTVAGETMGRWFGRSVEQAAEEAAKDLDVKELWAAATPAQQAAAVAALQA